MLLEPTQPTKHVRRLVTDSSKEENFWLRMCASEGRAGLIEIPLTILGVIAVQFMRPLLPYAMGFAAGAMLYVISDEIIPETHGTGNERLATIGTMVGVMVMLYLRLKGKPHSRKSYS